MIHDNNVHRNTFIFRTEKIVTTITQLTRSWKTLIFDGLYRALQGGLQAKVVNTLILAKVILYVLFPKNVGYTVATYFASKSKYLLDLYPGNQHILVQAKTNIIL